MEPDARLGPAEVAGIIATVAEGLGEPVTLVGNDSGGAYSQIAVAEHGARVRAMALTSCETPYDEWPPAPFDGLPALARDPEALGAALAALRDPEVRAAPVAFGLLHKRPLDPPEAADSYALPASSDPGVLRDVAKVMASASTAPVVAAARKLIAEATIPIHLVWSSEDAVFPVDHARRYAAELRHGSIDVIDDSYSFTPEDQPATLAALLADFAGSQSGGKVPAGTSPG
jgi:pimeloyl-ACP methyl ester carboxylesterase